MNVAFKITTPLLFDKVQVILQQNKLLVAN